MADETKEKAPEPLITEDDMFDSNAKELNRRIEENFKERLEKAIEEYKKENAPAAPQKAPDEILKEFACFGSEDEDVREAAESMLERELAKLPDKAGVEKVKEACDKVSRRIAKLASSGDGKKDDSGKSPYDTGPVQTGGGSAAAAHITQSPPKTIDEAYERSARIAAEWGKK